MGVGIESCADLTRVQEAVSPWCGVRLNMAKKMEMEALRIMPHSMACETGSLVMPYIPRENKVKGWILVEATEFSLGVKVIWDCWTSVNKRMLEDYV